jgi:hypothetical protein
MVICGILTNFVKPSMTIRWIVFCFIQISCQPSSEYIIDTKSTRESELERRNPEFETSKCQESAISFCTKCFDWELNCKCDFEPHSSEYKTLNHYAQTYNRWRESIINFEYESQPSKWLTLILNFCQCEDVIIALTNGLQIASFLNYSIVLQHDLNSPNDCHCMDMITNVTLMTSEFLVQHAVFIRNEYVIDLSQELDCVMNTECLLSEYRWSAVSMNNAAYAVVSIAPKLTFFDASEFEEYLGLRFLAHFHHLWPHSGFDTLFSGFACISSTVWADSEVYDSDNKNWTLIHALGSCIRRNKLYYSWRGAELAPAKEIEKSTGEEYADSKFWFCHPCQPNQSWTWNESTSLANTSIYFPSIALHKKDRSFQQEAADSYHDFFRQKLNHAAHQCGNICEHCTVAKGLFFLARELATCFRSNKGYREILNSWKWVQGLSLTFHDMFARNTGGTNGRRHCRMCEHLDPGFRKIWDTAHALRLVYTLTDEFEQQVESTLPYELRKGPAASRGREAHCVIGVHIRRGDSCIDTVGSSGVRRECYPTERCPGPPAFI